MREIHMQKGTVEDYAFRDALIDLLQSHAAAITPIGALTIAAHTTGLVWGFNHPENLGDDDARRLIQANVEQGRADGIIHLAAHAGGLQ